MFKIESYITPIILTYLEKYVRDFKSEDAQVSLWSGGVALYNLVLKPDVIQREFNLPFYITSGKIHELLINIPWMKIVSEPIVVTINAMECVVTLKEVADISRPGSTSTQNSVQSQVMEAPPGYISSIINKIVNNVSIQCHHLIFKYIEEDIVVSVNIKHLKLESTNGEWKASFSEINPVDLSLRKCLKLTNLTLCLDKMNAEGNIPVYQEPLLYHCDLEIRVLNKYQTINCKRPLYSHMMIMSEKLEFSVSFQQLPMFYRILVFLKAINTRELRVRPSNIVQGTEAPGEQDESWAQWAWSFVPAVGSVFAFSESGEQVEREHGHANFIMTVNVEHLSFVFKVPEPVSAFSRKSKQRPIWELSLFKITCQSSVCSPRWFSLRGGFESATLSSEGPCVCDHEDFFDNVGETKNYLALGSICKQKDSTTESQSSESSEKPEVWPIVFRQTDAEINMTEEQMKRICPGFSVEVNNMIWMPDDCPEAEMDAFEGNFEYSNFDEESKVSAVVGHFEATLSTGFMHRFSVLLEAFNKYDYAPYRESQQDLPFSRIPSLSLEEYGALINCNKQLIVRILCYKPCINVPACDHKMSAKSSSSVHCKQETHSKHLTEVVMNVPYVGFEASKIEINLTAPLYPKRFVYATCKMDPPHPYLWKECHSNTNIIMDKLALFLLYRTCVKTVACRKFSPPSTGTKQDLKSRKHRRKAVVAQTSVTMTAKLLLKPHYFIHNEPVLVSFTLNADEFMWCSSMPRLLTTGYLLLSSITLTPAHQLPLCTTSIIQDSIKDSDAVHVDLTLEGLSMRWYDTENTHTRMITLNAARVLALKPDRYENDRQAWIISAPDRSSKSALLRVALQYTDTEKEGELNFFGLWSEPSSFCLDPLITEWFTYAPLIPPIKINQAKTTNQSGMNMNRKSLDETVHSSAKLRMSADSQENTLPDGELQGSALPLNSKEYNRHADWSFESAWNSPRMRELLTAARSWCVNIETGLMTIYFPADTVPTLGKSTLADALDKYVTDYKSLSPAVIIYSLGVINFQSASSRPTLWALVKNDGPTFIKNKTVTETLKNSFPWKMTITDMFCQTLAKKPSTIKSLLKQSTKPTPLLHLTTFAITFSLVIKPKVKNESSPVTGTNTPRQTGSATKIQGNTNKKLHLRSDGEECERSGNVFGLCVHIDTTPITFTMSEAQILLIARIIHGVNHLIGTVVRNVKYLLTIQYHVGLDEFIEDSMIIDSVTEFDSVGDLSSQPSSSMLLIFERITSDTDWRVSIWLQWVVSRFTIKCFVLTSVTEYKLVFDAEDIILTYDGQYHYSKLKLKVSTLNIKHFRRSRGDWVFGDFSGIVLRGHDTRSGKIQGGFLTLTLTTATSDSVQKQWNDEFKPPKAGVQTSISDRDSTQFQNLSIMNIPDTKGIVQEVQLTLQSLDVVLSGAVLHKFVDLFKPFYAEVSCPESLLDDKADSASALNIEALKSDKFPLFYFDCSQIGIVMPVRNLVTAPEHEMDALIIEIGSVIFSPHPENPICRKPLDLDLYQSAARSNMLHMPGSSLEDRQYQLGVKNLVVHISNWEIISEKFPKYNLTENPAFFWQFDNEGQNTEVIVQLELSAVVALAMIFEHRLVCPPAVEFNIVSDMCVVLCTTDINVIRELVNEIMGISCNECASKTKTVLPCPYFHYFHKRAHPDPTPYKHVVIESTAKAKASDSGCESIYSVPMTALRAYSKHVSIVEQKSRKKTLEYFEFYFTAGKVWLNIYHCEISVVRSMRMCKDRNVAYTPLIYFDIHQPNVFVSKAQNDWKLRMSLFDMTFSVGGDECQSYPDFSKFRSPLLETERGDRDPFTGIPPALMSIEIEKAHMRKLEIVFLMERPVRLALSKTRCFDLQSTLNFLHIPELAAESVFDRELTREMSDVDCNWIRFIMRDIEEGQLMTTQIVLLIELSNHFNIQLGIDSISASYTTAHRPDRVSLKILGNGLSISDGTNYILKPNTFGARIQVNWEMWQRNETNWCHPMLYILVESESVLIELIPHLADLYKMFQEDLEELKSVIQLGGLVKQSTSTLGGKGAQTTKESPRTAEDSETFYKDDLRIGTFKLLKGGQLPMAYQVTIDKYSMTWRYPHPRAITRILSFPIPTQDADVINCVLEYYSETLEEFVEYVYFEFRTDSTTKLALNTSTPRVVFASSWRVRILGLDYLTNHKYTFVFRRNKYSIKKLPSDIEEEREHYHVHNVSLDASALAPALRIDSYFSPLHISRNHFVFRSAKVAFNVHNSVYDLGEISGYDGYYLSKTYQKYHPFLSALLLNTVISLQNPPNKGHYMIGFRSELSLCAQDPHAFSMGYIIAPTVCSGTYWRENDVVKTIVETDVLPFDLQLDRMVLVENLVKQWVSAISTSDETIDKVKSARLAVKYLIVNLTECVLRIGQEFTSESVLLSASTKYAYRWYQKSKPHQLRIGTARGDWFWSRGFDIDSLGQREIELDPVHYSCNIRLYAKVAADCDAPSYRVIEITGRFLIWNILPIRFLYSVQETTVYPCSRKNPIQGSLPRQCLALSVVAAESSEVSMKLKIIQSMSTWSGEIPLRECPKKNIPWLVKIPCSNVALDYISVWCQVITDPVTKRVLVSLWPLYMIKSYLPFDTDMHVRSEECDKERVVPVCGQGQESQFFTAGTTATKHKLSFSFSGLQAPALSADVPLHYGVIKGDVFTLAPENRNFEDIQQYYYKFLTEENTWPYTEISSDIARKWGHSLSQPNVDVMVRYSRLPFSSTLVVNVAPWGLIANSADITLTLRGSNLSFLCEIASCAVMALPRVVAKKEFYLTIDEGQSLWTSCPLRISEVDLGSYGKPEPGVIHVDHCNTIGIVAKDKIGVLRLDYSIHNEINVFGVASQYVLTNYLDMLLMVCPVAIPCCCDFDSYKQPTYYVPILPRHDEMNEGIPITKFQLTEMISGALADISSVRLFLQFSLPNAGEMYLSKPINLNNKTKRRPIVLRNNNNVSIACVVTYTESQGRAYIGIHQDPCPQFLIENNTRVPLVVSACTDSSCDVKPNNLPTFLAVKECHRTTWFCSIEAGTKTYYSTPSYCANYPEVQTNLQPTSCNLMLAHAPMDNLTQPEWSQPVNISLRETEVLVQLKKPTIDLKLTVQGHLHTSILTIENITSHEICASEVRDRLENMWVNQYSDDTNNSTDESEPPRKGILRENASFRLLGSPGTNSGSASPNTFANLKPSMMLLDPNSESVTPMNQSRLVVQSPTGNSQSTSTTSSMIIKTSVTIKEDALQGPLKSSVLILSKPRLRGVQKVPDHLSVLIKGIQISVGTGYEDKIRLTADHLSLLLHRHLTTAEYELSLRVGDLQVDNPLAAEGGYDFPVVFVNQEESKLEKRLMPVLTPICNTFGERIKQEGERKNCVLQVTAIIDEWKLQGFVLREMYSLEIEVGKIALYLEDNFITSMAELATMYKPIEVLEELNDAVEIANLVVPGHVVAEALDAASPLTLNKLHIKEIPLVLSLRTNVRMYLALDHSPLQLETYQRFSLITTPFRLGHSIALHYLSGCIVGAGWVVGSLEILGSPGTLARRVGVGLRDLVLEPWRGLAGGPKSLMRGARTGAASLAKNVAGGAVSSVSLMCGSVARNLDKVPIIPNIQVACDEEHARRAADLRRRRPDNLLEGVGRGLSGLFVTLLGAIGGIAHHPLVSVEHSTSNMPVAVAAGITKGIIGAVAKPLSATADLVALAGRGLLSQTGWDSDCEMRTKIKAGECCMGVRERTRWTFLLVDLVLKHAMQAKRRCDDGNHQDILLLITRKWLILIDDKTDSVIEMIDVKKFFGSVVHGDGTLEMFICDKYNTDGKADHQDESMERIDTMARVAAYASGATPRAQSLGPGTRTIWLLMTLSQAHYAATMLQACKSDALKSHFTMCSNS